MRRLKKMHRLRARGGVTLDSDVETLLRSEVRRRRQPFKQVLNDAIRAGLQARTSPRPERFRPLTFDMGMPRVDLTKALRLVADLEDLELIRSAGRLR